MTLNDSGVTSGELAPPVVAPPPGNPRFPLFDGLRAIAALSIVLLHTIVVTDYFPGWQGAVARQLAAGVAIFFVISGFLLYRPFVAARISGRSPIRLRDYTRRRILRIVPAYWFALTVLAIWPGLPGDVFSSDWWLYYGFGQDFREDTLFNGLGTAWSLGTEVTFYLALPLYAFVLGRSRFRRSLRSLLVFELATLALLSIGSLAFRAAVSESHPNLAFTLLGTFDWFALGMGLAVISAVVAESGRRPRALALVERIPTLSWGVSLGFIGLAALYWQQTTDYNGYSGRPLHVLWGLFALFLVLPAAFEGRRSAPPGRILSLRLVAWLGIVSYGIYLWHLPLVPELARALDATPIGTSGLLATVLLAVPVVAVTVACAAFSYYVVERPILRYKDRRRRTRVPFRGRPRVESAEPAASPVQMGSAVPGIASVQEA